MSDLTNLLPASRIKLQRREYYLRLGTIAFAFGIVLMLIAAALILPAYAYLSRAIEAAQEQLNTVTSSQSGDESSLAARVAAITTNGRTISTLGKTPTAITTLGGVLAVAHPGVSLLAFKYTPGNPRTVVVTGVAANRDTLRNYQISLQADPLVKNADLPVSAYAKDSGIPFTVTLTLSP